jgi:hypothetical protein
VTEQVLDVAIPVERPPGVGDLDLTRQVGILEDAPQEQWYSGPPAWPEKRILFDVIDVSRWS